MSEFTAQGTEGHKTIAKSIGASDGGASLDPAVSISQGKSFYQTLYTLFGDDKLLVFLTL
jgi:hypothetical protein